MAYVMGIDIGTYESKGVLTDEQGNVIAYQKIDHQLEIPHHGWAEHDALGTWWYDFTQLSHALIAEGKAKCGLNPQKIQAVLVSTIGPAVVPVDRTGEPLRKAILYGVDTRAGQEIEYLNEKIGEEAILKHSGHRLSSQSAGAKILWIRNHEPDVYEKTYKFLSGNGYLVYKMTGEHLIDYYTACAYSPLFDLSNQCWHSDHVAYVTDMHRLPKIAWSHEIAGEMTTEAAHQTGLKAGTKVMVGTTDAMSESISVGAVNQGDMMLMYGSSTFFVQVIQKPTPMGKFWPSIHAVPDLSTLTGGTSTAGSITRWFLDQWSLDPCSKDEGYTRLTAMASESRAGSNGLIMLPYFSGERTPINHLNARGVFFGLTLKHTTGDLYRSILEGIGYSIRHNIEEMQDAGFGPQRIVAVGGGTKSPLWLQIVSSICRVDQYITKVTSGAAYGNTFLAALGLGWYDRLDQISEWIGYSDVIHPVEEDALLYDRYYALYREIYGQTKETMDKLSML